MTDRLSTDKEGQSMKIYDNIHEIVKDDMAAVIVKGCKVSVAAACFSIYAYEELKKQLNAIGGFRFIFTSPTFTKKKAAKEKREFYISQLAVKAACMGHSLRSSLETK